MSRKGRNKKTLLSEPLKCVVLLSSDEEIDCLLAERKENKQLNRVNEFVDRNNLIPMKIYRTGIFGRRVSNEIFQTAVRYMQAGKAEALVAVNLDAISYGIADAYYKVGVVREAGFRLFTVDEKEPMLDIYTPPKKKMEE
jgi:hypothetical protein